MAMTEIDKSDDVLFLLDETRRILSGILVCRKGYGISEKEESQVRDAYDIVKNLHEKKMRAFNAEEVGWFHARLDGFLRFCDSRGYVGTAQALRETFRSKQ
jgi:hypothetical protein